MYILPEYLQVKEESLILEAKQFGCRDSVSREVKVFVLQASADGEGAIPNAPSKNWTLFGMKDSSTLILKAPSEWQTFDYPVVALVRVSDFLQWQAYAAIEEIELQMLYNLSTNLTTLTCMEHISCLGSKLVKASSLINKKTQPLTEQDHGKIFKVIVPNNTKARRVMYVRKGLHGRFVFCEGHNLAYRDINAINCEWLIETTSRVSSVIADVQWAHVFAHSLDATPQTLSFSQAAETFPYLNVDSLIATDLKEFPSFSIGIDFFTDNVRIASLPILAKKLPSALSANSGFVKSWGDAIVRANGAYLFTRDLESKTHTVHFHVSIDPKSKKFVSFILLDAFDSSFAFPLPEMTSTEFIKLLEEWFNTSNWERPLGIKLRKVEGIYTGRIVPTRARSILKECQG
jgi:hypothetical protein